MNYIVIAYSIYLPVALALTIWVARTLHTNGKVFLNDIFHQQNELAASVNKLLQVGFYLINVGFAVIRLKIEQVRVYDPITNLPTVELVDSVQKVLEVLSYKLGGFTLMLGLILFIYLFVLLQLRNSSISNRELNNNYAKQNVVFKGV